MRIFVPVAAASLLAGCVQPTYAPAPIDLQNYGALPPYRSAPTYREPLPAPVPIRLPDRGPAPTAEPLPPPSSEPPATDETGPIPLQEMPQPAPEASSSANGQATAREAAPIVKNPTSGPGSNVPLEGFRPMRGQTKPTP